MNEITPSDPTIELRDIRPAIEIPDPAGWPLWATLALAALALAIGAVLWWRWRQRRQATSTPDPISLALSELEATRAELGSVDAETYAMAVSDVLRRFIEQRFEIAAVRQTSEEFLQGLTAPRPEAPHAINQINQTQRTVLRDFLRQCDLVKFARGQLDRSQREQLYDVARSFIQANVGQAEAASQAAPTISDPNPIPSAQSA